MLFSLLIAINNSVDNTSQLIASLEEQQKQRLANPPALESPSGHFRLSSPSEQEFDTGMHYNLLGHFIALFILATQITSELVSLASKVRFTQPTLYNNSFYR